MDLPVSSIHVFCLILTQQGKRVLPESIIHEYALTNQLTDRQLQEIAEELGYDLRLLSYTPEVILASNKLFPVMVQRNDGSWIILAGRNNACDDNNDDIFFTDPTLKKGIETKIYADFLKELSGNLFLLKKKETKNSKQSPFGFIWFLNIVSREKKRFYTIFILSLFLTVISLITPYFFQVVIDKVLVLQARDTLRVLGVGIFIALIFGGIFEWFRGYLIILATRSIDADMYKRAFSHLISLPIHYFEENSTGTIAKHLEQVSTIRQFLTGKLFLTTLDLGYLVVFFPFLYFYSPKLTFIVLCFTVTIALFIGVLLIPFRRKLFKLYQVEAYQQSLIIEAIKGIVTIKSMAMEALNNKIWQESVADVSESRFKTGKISIAATAFSELLSKIMTVTIIWVGANSIFSKDLTVGQLVAFQMLAGRVVGPLVQLVSLIHDYQEASLSLTMMGNIMNNETESGSSRGGVRIPFQEGVSVEFERVTYRYPSNNKPIFDSFNLEIPAGKIIGIVGKSGSGKSTLAKMIQGHCIPESGILRIGGIDIREQDLAYLRQSFGIVLQENFLFNGSIRENIIMGNVSISENAIKKVVALSGASEFIDKMPDKLDTFLEEGGGNLSGGQKQRLAIARALLMNPKLLILDEATSSLDPQSETIIRDNLKEIAATRTVIIVSHRLSMVCQADAIIVLDDGKLVGYNRHSKLLEICPLYNRMWDLQMTRQK